MWGWHGRASAGHVARGSLILICCQRGEALGLAVLSYWTVSVEPSFASSSSVKHLAR